jgi:hypothetical protein
VTWTGGSHRSHREKSRQGGVIYRCLVHRDIGDPGDKVFMHFGFAKSETPTGRKVPPCGQLSAERREAPLWEPAVSKPESQDSRNRESRGQVFSAFETP